MRGAGGGGGGADPQPSFTELVDSNLSVAADISKDLGTLAVGPPTLASTFGNVQAGVTAFDLLGVPVTDTRGFLNFPLSSIPLAASIRFASVTVFMNSVTLRTPSLPSPFFVDLIDTVTFPTPIVSSDYSAAWAATRSVNFLNSDQGRFVENDVTSLMREAQRLSLPSFEIRIAFNEEAFLANPSTTRGWVEIDDQFAVPGQRPLLTVDYVI